MTVQRTLTNDQKSQQAQSTKAHEMAAQQRDIGIGEFFSRNRHLLGFDNKKKGLLTTVKEAVDNSLDACEEASILPEISVDLIEMGQDRMRIVIEDNGPGIVKDQIGNIFAKLLYGSKFHRLKQSRGQQGIGISAAVMYGQLTTGRAARVKTRISPDYPAHFYKLKIDTQKNKPSIEESKDVDWDKEHGTRIEIDLEATYQGGQQSVDEYLRETAITNPHATFIYTNPKAEQIIFPRAVDMLPHLPKEIKPHPYGVELGVMMDLLNATSAKTLQSFLTTEFSRVSSTAAKQICESAALLPDTKPKQMTRGAVEQLMKGINNTKLMGPPTDCLAPINAEHLEKGMRKEINAEFFSSTTRSPAVYRGNPFVIEVGMAYGGELKSDGAIKIMRYANRVPLLYQQGACAVTKSVTSNTWRSYGLNQSKGNIPTGPMVLAVHIASVWVPFTSESKEAVANYPEIIKEIKLGIQECGRKLSRYVAKKKKIQDESKKRGYIKKYIPHVSNALKSILELKEADAEEVKENLAVVLEDTRGKLEDMSFDPSKNTEYDEEFARIGRGEESEDDEE
mgnify:CR=1 FL=1